MSVLASSLPHASAVPLPVTNSTSSSTSSDAAGLEGLVSSLSTTSFSMTSSTFTATTTSTGASTTVTVPGEGEQVVGDGKEEKSSHDELKMNEILTSNARATSTLSARTKFDVHHDGGHTESQIIKDDGSLASASPTFQFIDFTPKSSAPYTPTSASASLSIAMPSPKSDEGAGRTTATRRQQHRKSASVNGAISSLTLSGSNAITTTTTSMAKTHHTERPRGSSVQLRSRAIVNLDQKEKGAAMSIQQQQQQQPLKFPEERYPSQQVLVNTPPEMLPPSPPLTNNELEMDDDDVDADVDLDADADTHTHTHSQSQTETSGVEDDDDDGDEDGVNPQIEADIADGWQAPDSKLEATTDTPVLQSQSPSTTSLPSGQIVQESKFALPSPSPLSRPTLDDQTHPLSSALSLSSPSSSKFKIPPPHSLDIDLEKGGDSADYGDSTVVSGGDAKRRASIEPEAETASALGVTKTFEVIRSSKRFSSHKPPKSSYYIGPPTGPTAYGTAPTGRIGLHHPREIVRIERDYDHGELVQFSSAYPLELEGRITPTQFLETVNAINERLIRAHSLSGAFLFNLLAILTFWISPFFVQSTYKKEMRNLQVLVDALNAELYNPQGLNILWPRKNAFLFLEIEYY